MAAAGDRLSAQRSVFFAAADLLSLEVDLLLFDTTSTYFERDDEEPDGGLRRFGHSKDHRGDLPQIVIGLAVTREGIPVRVWVWPGNTNDHQVLGQVKDDLRGWRLGRVVTVVDRGFSSKENLDYLRRAGGHWIAGERMHDGAPDHDAALSRAGRYQTVRDNLRVKEVRLDEQGQRRFVVCHNPVEADRDKTRRDDTIARLEAELERINAARARTAKKQAGKGRDREAAAHTKAECALRDHPALSRYLRSAEERAAAHRPGEGQGRGTPGRQVLAVDFPARRRFVLNEEGRGTPLHHRRRPCPFGPITVKVIACRGAE